MKRQQRVAADALHMRLGDGDHFQQELVAVVVDGRLLQRRAALADEVQHHQSAVLLHAVAVDARQWRQKHKRRREQAPHARLHTRQQRLCRQRQVLLRRLVGQVVYRHHVLQHDVLSGVEGDERRHTHLHDVLAGQAQLDVEAGERAGAGVLDLVAEALGHVEQQLVERRGVVQEVRALEENHRTVVTMWCDGRLVVKGVEHNS